MQPPSDPPPPSGEAARRRGLQRHFAFAFAALAIAAAAGLLVHPPLLPWIVAAAVLWGAPLALHTAWAAGIFGHGEDK